jgi:2-polyprenyl-3-methyl-5-hydroxy-6-metoxy-1,4-benzoquinol methylase
MDAFTTSYGGRLDETALADANNTHAILLRLVGHGRDVLEIGCATGYMSRILSEQQQCRVTGFEINPVAAEEARPFLKQLVVGNVEDAADREQITGSYDVILIADVLEHLAWPEEPLRNLRRHLRPSGRLIVSLPNVAHWSVRRALLRGRWQLTERGLMDRTHLRWYTRKTALALIEGTGYHPVAHYASYAFPGHWRLGIGPRLAQWAQRRQMPAFFGNLFAIQHIFVATLPP